MCGLFGSLGKVLPNDLIELSFMSMQHRGPDDAYSITRIQIFYLLQQQCVYPFRMTTRQTIFVYSDNLTGHEIVASLNGEHITTA